jgi:hypothetical protein
MTADTYQAATAPGGESKLMTWAGRVLWVLSIAFMLFDSIIKLVLIQPVVDSFTQLGYPVSVARPIGMMSWPAPSSTCFRAPGCWARCC